MSIHLIDAFDYALPEQLIAQTAMEPRDASKLLFYQEGQIHDQIFKDLPDVLPKGAQLVFNNAKVIQARLFARTQTNAKIEVFLLQPHGLEYSQALSATQHTQWQCMIGNKKKWKPEEIIQIEVGKAQLRLKQLADQVVDFAWDGGISFGELLELVGQLPLPPYIKHTPSKADQSRYQTVFSKIEGSVAAPTAGLHFTENVLSNLDQKGFKRSELTLHVSAGTFLPVKVEQYRDHTMHRESYEINIETLESLIHSDCLVAVGTTATRVLESLYWAGIQLLNGVERPFEIPQFVYELPYKVYSKEEVIQTLISDLTKRQQTTIYGNSAIMIVPGYTFKMVKGLVTNFHQPKSTLLLLISALIGDNWRQVYQHAIEHNYRFLSYGDASLLLP